MGEKGGHAAKAMVSKTKQGQKSGDDAPTQALNIKLRPPQPSRVEKVQTGAYRDCVHKEKSSGVVGTATAVTEEVVATAAVVGVAMSAEVVLSGAQASAVSKPTNSGEIALA